ncbi:MAG: hypothetical protein ACTHOP_05315 [Mesorhizobium sp.]
MAARDDIEIIDRNAARLKPAAGSMRAPSASAAGPFEPVAPPRKGAGLGDALVTGLLVVYPAFATVAAVVVGFALSGGGA